MKLWTPRPDRDRHKDEPVTTSEQLDELVLAGAFDDPRVEASDPAIRELTEALAILTAQATGEVDPDPAFMNELALFTRAASPTVATSRPNQLRRKVSVMAVPVAATLAIIAFASAPHPSTTPTHKGVITLTHESPTGVTGPMGPTGITASSTTVPEGVQAFDQDGNPIVLTVPPWTPPDTVTTTP